MWADVLGAALSTGSQLSRQRRLDTQDEEERRLKMQREKQLIDLALRDQQLQEDDTQRSIADRLLANIGPLGQVDKEAAAALKAGGLGGRLQAEKFQAPKPTYVPSGATVESPILPGSEFEMADTGQTIIAPNRAEQISIDRENISTQERDRQAALREHLTKDPSALFAKGPMSAAVIWEQAGFKGDPPADFSQLKEKMDYEHQLRLQEIGARTSGDLQVARERASLGVDRPMTTGQEFNATMSVAKKYTTDTKAAREAQLQFNQMQAGLDAARKGDMAAGAQGVLVTFQKILDPTSVVRESEYARSGSGQSILNQMQGYVEKWEKGGAGVPLPELEKFVNLAGVFAQNQAKVAQMSRAQAEGFAKRFNLPIELVAPPIDEQVAQPGGGGTEQTISVTRGPDGKLKRQQ